MSSKAKAAVFTGPGKGFDIREFPLPEVKPGAILARVKMSTICGSDVHTWQGKRSAPVPIILGHEIVGRIEVLGDGIETDTMGKPLSVGDRITWTVMASCGRCYYCRIKCLPQKCVNLYKYGHQSCEEAPHLNGGLAEYIYIKPGTSVFKVPDHLSDEEIAPVNCALATMVNGLEAIDVQPNDNVLVQGAGMLGLYTTALLRERGVQNIILTDIDDGRLKLGREFKADFTVNVSRHTTERVVREIKDLTDGRGVDVGIEVCGAPSAVPQGIEMLCTGGKYLIVGTVFPKADFTLEGYQLVTKMITIKAIHNYDARHLAQGLIFLAAAQHKYPFKGLIGRKLSLAETEEAFILSKEGRSIRTAVVP